MANLRDSVVNSLVGEGSSLRGDIVVDGLVRIDGDLSGAIRSSGKVVIGQGGRCEASIQARSAIIGGLVKGDVCVTERLSVLDGAVIVGNVFAPRMDAEGEVVIHGDVMISGRTDKAEEALLDFQARHGTRISKADLGQARRPAGTEKPWRR
ncbi:MAG TPA: polymer-forming cytoskeletal protein [Magnetospirillaceae bacterium]|nr:polymer-forming cytoskeletal protein [Magnetospirillaceae bacterium]